MGGVGEERECFERLRTHEPVWFAKDACLVVRRPGMECGLCKEACPAGVLSGNQWSIVLEADGCIGCGLCAATCPTGAITVDQFAPAQHLPPHISENITIECRRAPPGMRDFDAIVVPCLGGLTVPDIVELSAKGLTSIAIQDHGWCSKCPIGGCSHPWEPNLESARSLLAQLDPQRSAAITVEDAPLPIDKARCLDFASPNGKQPSRRHFFQQIAGFAQPHDARESRRIVFGRGPVRPVQRERILETVAGLAREMGVPMPAGLMPSVTIGDACDLHGICAAICPTEALQKTANADGNVAIVFDAQKCIACGECQRACPSKALSLSVEGGEKPYSYPITLVSRRITVCRGCGATFVATNGDTGNLCAPCSRSINVMRDVSDFLSGRQLMS